MFMAKKLIITEEVKKQNNMAFKMRSGNKVSFKNMGSSPAKQASTETKKFYVDNYEENKDKPGFQEAMDKAFGGKTKMEGKTSITSKPTPAKQKLNIGGEGQDQNKIFNNKGEHVGDYINDKPVMRPGFKRPVVKKDIPVKPKDGDYEKYSDLEKYDDDRPVSPNKQVKQKEKKELIPIDLEYIKKNYKSGTILDGDYEKYSDLEKYDDDNPTGKAEPPKKKKSLKKRPSNKELMKMMEEQESPAKQAKTKGLGPRTAFGGVKNPELTKTKKPFSTKVMKDGPKKQVTGIDLGKDPHWQPHPDTFKTKKKK